MKNSAKNFSAMDSRVKITTEAISSYCQNLHFLLSAKRKLEDKAKSKIHVLYALQLVKSTSRDKAMLNREKIKPVALLIVELCLDEGIS